MLLAVVAAYLTFFTHAGAPDVDTAVAGFAERKTRFMDGIICRSNSSGYYDTPAQRGMMMLEKALVTNSVSGTTSCGTNWSIAAAQSLIVQGAAMAGTTAQSKVVHAGVLNQARIYLKYKDKTVGGQKLLADATAAALKSNQGLGYYRGNGVDPHTSTTGLFDVTLPSGTMPGTGTENHELQTIVSGIVLAQVFAGETFNGNPVSSYLNYYTNKFYEYFSKESNGRSRFSHDMPATEKDTLGYLHVYLGDMWMLVDFGRDAAMKKHAEIILDRMLADQAEDLVRGLYTGYSGRHYHRNHVSGDPMHEHNYLLYDNLGYTPTPQALASGSGWGNWLHNSILTSDYNPTSPDFPRAIIDLARNKGNGYMVQDGFRPQSNWVENDFALGFLLDNKGTYDSQQGGFYVNNSNSASMGLQAAPFIPSPYTDSSKEIVAGAFLHKNRPYRNDRGVMAPRVAIIKTEHAPNGQTNSGGNYSTKLKARLWLQDGFDARERSGNWLFLREPSTRGREVYLAVHVPIGGMTALAGTQNGQVYELNDVNNGFTIWEVGTSQEYSSFAAFKNDMLDNTVSVTASTIAYTSSKLGTTLVYNRSDNKTHKINGANVDWDAFKHGAHNPYVTNVHGSDRMTISKSGYSATYDWRPNANGSYAVMPTKTVCNTGNCGGGGQDTINPTVSFATPPTPAANATVSGAIKVQANASDDTGVARVEFYIDGQLIATERQAAYCLNGGDDLCDDYDTNQLSNGQRLFEIRAFDAAGNSASATRTLTIQNGPAPDTQPPTVSFVSPQNGTTVSETVFVDGIFSDNVGVTRVEFLVDGQLTDTSHFLPHDFDWNTAGVANGTYTLGLRAFDAAGNNRTATVTVTVYNAPPDKPGDADGNGRVDIFDLSILLSNFGQEGGLRQGDFDNNGVINIFDLSILLSHYGT